MTNDCSLANRGTASVQPEQTSVATRLWRYSPDIDPPPCTTKSISTYPGNESCQSWEVLIAISLLNLLNIRFFFRLPVFSRIGRNTRSIVDALTDKIFLRSVNSNFKWPCRSIASTKLGITAFKRFPQILSDVSHNTINASFTASSYTLLLLITVDLGSLAIKFPNNRIACLRCYPDTCVNSLRMLAFSLLDALLYL